MVHSNFNPCPNICKNKNEFGICKSDKCINPYFNTSVTFTNTLDDMKFKDKNKSLIEVQAYNKFAELMLELYDGDIVNEMNCPVRIIRQNIKDIRDQLIKEAGEE